jgi:hypothetical protein
VAGFDEIRSSGVTLEREALLGSPEIGTVTESRSDAVEKKFDQAYMSNMLAHGSGDENEASCTARGSAKEEQRYPLKRRAAMPVEATQWTILS